MATNEDKLTFFRAAAAMAQEVSNARCLLEVFPVLIAKVSAVAKLSLLTPSPFSRPARKLFLYEKPRSKHVTHPFPACPSVYVYVEKSLDSPYSIKVPVVLFATIHNGGRQTGPIKGRHPQIWRLPCPLLPDTVTQLSGLSTPSARSVLTPPVLWGKAITCEKICNEKLWVYHRLSHVPVNGYVILMKRVIMWVIALCQWL